METPRVEVAKYILCVVGCVVCGLALPGVVASLFSVRFSVVSGGASKLRNVGSSE
jgi:hypothetical protein